MQRRRCLPVCQAQLFVFAFGHVYAWQRHLNSPSAAELSLFVTFTQSGTVFERAPGRRTWAGAEVKITPWNWHTEQDGNWRIAAAFSAALLMGRKLIHLMSKPMWTCHRIRYEWLEIDWQQQSLQTLKQHVSWFFSLALIAFYPHVVHIKCSFKTYWFFLYKQLRVQPGSNHTWRHVRAHGNNLIVFLTAILSALKEKKRGHLRPFSKPSHVAVGLQWFSVILSLGWIMGKSHEWPNTALIQTLNQPLCLIFMSKQPVQSLK